MVSASCYYVIYYPQTKAFNILLSIFFYVLRLVCYDNALFLFEIMFLHFNSFSLFRWRIRPSRGNLRRNQSDWRT